METEELRPIVFHENWPVPKPEGKDFLMRDLGEKSSAVVSALKEGLAAGLNEQNVGEIGRAAERDKEGTVLRIVHSLGELHKSCVDILITARGADLFVRSSVSANSWIKYLRVGLIVWMTWAMLLLFAFTYLKTTDALSVVQDDAIRQLEPGGRDSTAAARLGYTIDPETQEWVLSERKPLSTLIANNPRLAFTHFSGPLLIMSGLAGSIAFFTTTLFLDRFCSWLNWPSPASFNDFATSNEAWVTGVMARVFMDQYGAGEESRIRT